MAMTVESQQISKRLDGNDRSRNSVPLRNRLPEKGPQGLPSTTTQFRNLPGFVLCAHRDGEVRTPKFTPSTTDALFHIFHIRVSGFILGKGTRRAEGDTDSAAFAPGSIDVDPGFLFCLFPRSFETPTKHGPRFHSRRVIDFAQFFFI